jgi:hypothetical protein
MSAGDPPDGGTPEAPADPPGQVLRLRRAPRYRAFVLTGVLLGVLIAVVATLSFPVTGDYSLRTVLGYAAAVLALVGGLLGAAAAVLVERGRVTRGRRRGRGRRP